MLGALGRGLVRPLVVLPVLAALGIAVGILVAVNVYPGKPQIGVISLPFTVINEDSAFVVTSYLDYARRNPDIKAVVITLSSPGGGAAASERLYLETRRLREEKPVVMVMNGLVASGGYMMAMGTSHTYVKTSSLVGNVGVIAGSNPFLPFVPPEFIVVTGKSKLPGATRREWIGLVDLLKQSFVQMVVSERGDKLAVSPEELAEGRLYSGIESVRLGLADEIGDDSAAIEKAASMAGISNYELLDVNTEVNRIFVQKIRRIFAESDSGEVDGILSASLGMPYGSPNVTGAAASGSGVSPSGRTEPVTLMELNRLAVTGALTHPEGDPFPELPLEIKPPEIYYLYTGYTGETEPGDPTALDTP